MPDLRNTPTFQNMNVVEKVTYFGDRQKELVELEKNLIQASEINKAELQMAFGLTPGKPVSIVDLISIVAELVGAVKKPSDLVLGNKEEENAISIH